MIAHREAPCFQCAVETPIRFRVNFSLFLLIAVNLLPITGVLLWEWDVFQIVSLYWFENVVIGTINILKIATCCPSGDQLDLKALSRNSIEDEKMPAYLRNPGARIKVHHATKLFMIPFFTFHYGMFCFVHGVFVFELLGKKGGAMMSGGPVHGIGAMVSSLFDSGGKWFVIAIIASHLFSFFSNYLGNGEFRRTSAPALMASPYARIVVLHIAILFGAFAITALGSPIWLLILLILGKIVIDMKLHLRSHKKAAGT